MKGVTVKPPPTDCSARWKTKQIIPSTAASRFWINPGNNAMRVRFLENDPELTGAAQKARAIEFDRVSSALHSCMRQSGFGAHARALTELADFIKGRIRASPVRGEYSFEVETSIYQNGAVPPGFDKISSHALYIKGPGVDLKMHIAFNKSVPCYIFCTPEKADDLKQTSGAINAICDIIGTIKAQPKE